MKNKILWIVTILPTIITAVAIQFMDDTVPMHYGITGEIDRWGPKYENFTCPVMVLIFTLFWLLMISLAKRKLKSTNITEKEIKDTKTNINILYYAAIATTILFDVIQCVILVMAYNKAGLAVNMSNIDINKISNLFLGILLIVLGVLIPKCKKNAMVGIRTVWSMDNDVTWEKSNKIGGIISMITGVIVIVESLIIGEIISTFIALGIIIIMAVAMVICSYQVYKKYKTK